jgi:hypothetical protein
MRTKHGIQLTVLLQKRTDTGSKGGRKGKEKYFLNCSNSQIDAKVLQEIVYNKILRFAHDTKFFLIMKYCAIYSEETVKIS